MQTPVQIDFQGMHGTPEVRTSIEKHVADLERRYGRVTACRVVLKAPTAHHHTGGLYEVNIHLALPNGREVNAGRTPQEDERHADLSFAINDAFKHARRRLQDHVRRLQGQVKQHESQPVAAVKSLDIFRRIRLPAGRRWSRGLLSPKQRARWRIQPPRRGHACHIRRGDGREGTSGEHRQARWKAQTEGMRVPLRRAARAQGHLEVFERYRRPSEIAWSAECCPTRFSSATSRI